MIKLYPFSRSFNLLIHLGIAVMARNNQERMCVSRESKMPGTMTLGADYVQTVDTNVGMSR
jgi:hypothetical protein